jgi:hypothetical protein
MRYIYLYTNPEEESNGLIKIGQTDRSPEDRLRELNRDSGASSNRKGYFLETYDNNKEDVKQKISDTYIHNILESKGYPRISKEGGREWFKIKFKKIDYLISELMKGKRSEQISIDRYNSFKMRPEQKTAVNKTIKYFDKKEKASFLWNAKMRFGKTFAAYQLMKKQNYKRVLILTYKPAVHDQWKADLENHIDFDGYNFLSQQNENINKINDYDKVVCFSSYQYIIQGREKEDLKYIDNTEWDLIIIDEFHYGTSTEKAKDIFEKVSKEELNYQKKEELEKIEEEEDIDPAEKKQRKEEIEEEFEARSNLFSLSTKCKLYLSGTPFKALGNNIFSEKAIFNWTYQDEQKAKEEWDDKKGRNPYLSLPKIKLFVYKVSEDLEQHAIDTGMNEFSLNLFFKATNKKNKEVYFGDSKKNNDDLVNKWLDDITGRRKKNIKTLEEELDNYKEIEEINFPFDPNSPFRDELNHTLWYMPNVASALAMEKLLKKHIDFQHYKIIVVVGGRSESGSSALPPVKEAIKDNPRTITLTCGMLTTGVSVPEWSAVFFLRDIKAPESYFQTAFRAQTPYMDRKGNILKDTAYIFDFSPNRSLRLLTEYSEKLSDKKNNSNEMSSKEKIGEFIKYLPVLKVSGNRMVALNASQVLKFDYDKLDVIGLGQKFSDTRNVKIDNEIIDIINADKQKFDEIFSKIKKFSEFHGETKNRSNDNNRTPNTEQLNTSKGNLEDAKRKKANKELDGEDTKQEDKEIDKEKQKMEKEKKRIRDLLKTLLSRIPLFMYLTDASEENLEDVLSKTERDLFRQATGLKTEEFRFLKEIGLIKIDSIEGYILKYKEFEDDNFKEINNNIKGEK